MVKATANPRTVIPAAQLYAILLREFRKRRSPRCANCRIPLPFYRESPDDVSANWDIGTPAACPKGCDAVIAELLAELWTRYDMEKPRE